VPNFFKKYIDLSPDNNIMEALPKGGIELFSNNIDQLKALGYQTYASDKWTINQIIEHLMDTERIFLNRILRFSRNDATELPGFNENQYASNARSNEIPIEKLMQQYVEIRQTTVSTFSNFNEEELMRTGVANGQEISVLAMGFILIGHPIHHYKVVEERYFSLIVN
jgi:uncharacterized damage-inducible protein DinB